MKVEYEFYLQRISCFNKVKTKQKNKFLNYIAKIISASIYDITLKLDIRKCTPIRYKKILKYV